jgi:hypothetical protein
MLQSMVEEMLLYALETSILPSKTERLLRRNSRKLAISIVGETVIVKMK